MLYVDANIGTDNGGTRKICFCTKIMLQNNSFSFFVGNNCQEEEDRIHSVFQMITKVTQMKSPLSHPGKQTI